MTKSTVARSAKPACAWCGRRFAVARGPGRPRRYCKRACRQRDYEARRRAGELGLGERELAEARDALETLRDRLFVLEQTIADAQHDLVQPEARRVAELRRIMNYVLASARECVR